MPKRRANGEGNIRKRKDGRWEGRYTAGYDPESGKRIIKNVLGKTQAEVKEKLKAAISESQRLDVSKAGNYTVASWVRTWYEVYAEPRIRPNTKAYYTHTGKGPESTGQGQTGIFLSGPVFLPHLLADDPADGVRRVLFHLRRGVGVGVQRESRRVVAQRAGQRFYVHAAFQRQRGEGVAEIVKPDVFRADGLQNFVMGSPEGIRVIRSSGLWRGEQVRV